MKSILVADDLLSWRKFHFDMLTRLYDSDVKIDMAESASFAYDKLLEQIKTPYDIVITDLQMESDFMPKYAGEWLVEQIKMLPQYYKTKIVIISSTNGIRLIADNYGVDYIPKSASMSVSQYADVLLKTDTENL